MSAHWTKVQHPQKNDRTRTMRRPPTVLAAMIVFVCACATSAPLPYYKAPLAPSPRNATQVQASFATTWSAAVDVFAESNVPIETIDRASGLLVPAPLLYLSESSDSTWADCGQALGGLFKGGYHPVIPDAARYNVRVKGDS